jgi:hypothetical protein
VKSHLSVSHRKTTNFMNFLACTKKINSKFLNPFLCLSLIFEVSIAKIYTPRR